MSQTGGTLTTQERQQINGEQNTASRQIYDEKHNGNTVAPNEVDNREANQQQRTANGLRSGQMTSGEAARTNQNQARLDQQVHNERTANGGRLTAQQKSRQTTRKTRIATRFTKKSTTTRRQNQKSTNRHLDKERSSGRQTLPAVWTWLKKRIIDWFGEPQTRRTAES